jgi:hypothetical protein
MPSLRTAIAVSIALLSLAGASDDRIVWEKADQALTKSAATGRPVIWYFVTNQLSKDAGALPMVESLSGAEKALSNPVILKRRDLFLWVRGDQALATKLKIQGAPMVLFTDSDGDVIHKASIPTPEALFDAMMSVQKEKYVNAPISWGDIVRTGPIKKRLLVVAFDDEKSDGLSALEDRSVVKYHSKCEFVKLTYQKDSDEAKKWGVTQTPAILICDPAEHVLERLVGKKLPLEVKASLQKALRKLDDPSHAPGK